MRPGALYWGPKQRVQVIRRSHRLFVGGARWGEDVEDFGAAGTGAKPVFNAAGRALEISDADRDVDAVLDAHAAAFEHDAPLFFRMGVDRFLAIGFHGDDREHGPVARKDAGFQPRCERPGDPGAEVFEVEERVGAAHVWAPVSMGGLGVGEIENLEGGFVGFVGAWDGAERACAAHVRRFNVIYRMTRGHGRRLRCWEWGLFPLDRFWRKPRPQSIRWRSAIRRFARTAPRRRGA